MAPTFLSLRSASSRRRGALDRRQLARAVQQARLLADLRVVVLDERVGVERDAQLLAVVVGPLKASGVKSLGSIPCSASRSEADRGEHARRPELVDPAQVHDGHVRRAAGPDGHGQLGVVRVTPGQDRRLQVDVGVRLRVGSLHGHHVGAVTTAKQIPVDQRGPGCHRRWSR